MTPLRKIGPAALVLLLFAAGSLAALNSQSPRRLILIIGDGMDDNQITIARNFLVGAEGTLEIDRLPRRSAVQVLTVTESEPHLPVYVADSANSATTLATGVVTSRGRIATTAGGDEDLVTIVEQAHAAGLGTGLVTTSAVTDATPASFIAHVSSRGCKSPKTILGAGGWPGCPQDSRAQGGPGSIAEQLAVSPLDVLLGGGAGDFQQEIPAGPFQGKSVLEVAEKSGFSVITTAGQLRDDFPSEGRVMGLFAPEHLPVSWMGEEGRGAEQIARNEAGRASLPMPFTCVPNPAFEAVPTLKEMTAKALQMLAADHSRGFFLMVESASIDKQSHQRNPCGSIGEVLQLDQVVALAREFARSHPETLILVTADHGQAAQLVGERSIFSQWTGQTIASPGYFARLLTPEDSLMGVNYATNDYVSEEHTGVNIPLLSTGPGAAEIPPYLTQRDIYDLMTRHLELDKTAAGKLKPSQ